MDGVAEVTVKSVHIAAVPRHLDSMADGALHPAGGGAVFLCDFRIQTLGHSVDVIRLIHREKNGIPQELVALDVGRHADLDEIVRKALIQQFLHHFLALECARHEEGCVPLPCRVVALLDRQCIQPGHEGVQQHHLRVHREHFLQDFVAVFLHDGHFHALLLQRLTAGGRDLSTGIRHQKSHFVHGCFLQCVQFP